MSRMQSRIMTLAILGASVLLAGCGSKLVHVKGVVTIDGQPADHAFVMFTPQEPGGKEAHGSTDAAGRFQLSTFRPGDGAMPGTYKITVAYSRADPNARGPMSPPEPEDAERKPAPASTVLPPIYTQIDQTVLKHRVPDDGDVKLELKTGAP